MAHTAQDHVPEKDRGKFLKFTQKAEIAHAVKIAPLQNASEYLRNAEYLRNVQDSPTKSINHKYKNSVALLQRKQRKQIIAVTLDGTANVVVEFTASGATKTCSLVQLEGGTVYSPFEYRQREEEIALCQRYYQSFQDPPLRGVASTDTRPVRMGMVLPVQMRQAPNASFTGTISYFDGATVGNITGVFASWLKASHVEFTFNGTVGLATAGRAVVIFQDPNGFMNLEAEL
jgi:hypothetical protein